MNEDALVSIIVPVYNVDKYLKECLDSVVNQTYKNIEIIIVNDGSTDNSLKICEIYSVADSRIKIINQDNQGLSAARNSGIKSCKGDWIFFVDSDDILEKNVIRRLYNICKENGSQLGICSEYKFYDNLKHETSKNLTNTFGRREIIKKYFYREIPGYAWGKLYHKSLKPFLVFPEGRLFEDTYVLYKVLNNLQTVSVTSYIGYCYRQRNGSIVHSNYTSNQLDVLYSHLDALEYFNKDIDICQAVYSRLFVSSLDVLRKIPEEVKFKKDKEIALKYLKLSRKKAFNKRNGFLVCNMILISYISPYLLINLTKLRKFIKVKRV